MTDWTAGYVADIGYTYGYYQELNPLRVKLAFLNAGLVAPEMGVACELGFGQGMSSNIHAAASVTQWHGTDFNPSQAGFAREMAEASGAGARLYDEAFADFANRADLPEFDYIGLHGIWSWISDENRSVIVDFIRRKLKVGGVVYVSYNTLPGWAAMMPIRDMMLKHSDLLGVTGEGVVKRFDSALNFMSAMIETNPAYTRSNPQIPERINQLKKQDKNYLVHEYFNRSWLPMLFGAMSKWLEPAKIDYACSAHYSDHIDAVNLTPEQQTFLKGIPDAMFRESTRDFMVNQQFRKDYWVKGPRRLNSLEQNEAMRAQKIVLTTPRADVPMKVAGMQGEINMSVAIYTPILDLLADHKPNTIGQIEQAVKGQGINFAQVVQAVILLTGTGHLAAVQNDAAIAKVKECTKRLNAYLMDKSRGSIDTRYLASPVTGGGIPVGRFQQLFLLAMSQGKKRPADWAEFVWALLAAQGQNLVKDGKTLETPEANLAELNAEAITFSEKQLPILKALQIA